MSGAIDSLLTSLGPLAIVIVAAIVFAESGILAGFFLPGDSLLFTTGLLVAHGTIGAPIWLVACVIAVAAVAGDQVGYLIGRRVGPKVLSRPRSRLLDPAHLERAGSFFERHGPRAVVLARFVPVARTFTPVAAGAGRMEYATFLTYNVLSGIAWTVLMLAAGYLLGGVAVVSQHIEIITLGIVAVSLLPAALSLLRSRPELRERLLPWLVGAGAVSCTAAVLFLADAAAEHDGVSATDPPITETVTSHRTAPLTGIAQVVTFVGSEVSIGVLTALLLVVLVVGRRVRAALWSAAAMAGAAAFVVGIKHLVGRPRPAASTVLGPVDSGYSFPSGHTVLSTVFAAVVVTLLWPRLRSSRTKTMAVAVGLVAAAAVGASRVYLGYHWATDVIAAWLTAAAWSGVLWLAMRWRRAPDAGAGEQPRALVGAPQPSR